MLHLQGIAGDARYEKILKGYGGRLQDLLKTSDVRDSPLKEECSQEDYQSLLKDLACQIVTPNDLTSFSKRQKWLTCGDTAIDAFLKGGLPTFGSITEVTGVSGSGKTQLAVQLCLSVQLPCHLNGLDAGAVYLSSESGFPLPRLLQMTKGFKKRYPIMKDKDMSANVFIEKVTFSDILNTLQWRLPALLDSRNVRLIILDSIAGLLRAEVTQANQRAKYLHAIGHRLKELSVQFGVAIVCINQVSDKMNNPTASPYQTATLNTEYGVYPNAYVAQCIPAMGLPWSNEINMRIILSRKATMSHIRRVPSQHQETDDKDDEIEGTAHGSNDGSKRAKLMDPSDNISRQLHIMLSPHLPPKSIDFFIDADGVFGMEEEEENREKDSNGDNDDDDL